MVDERSPGLPPGVLAALVFVVALVALVVLLRGPGDGRGPELEDYAPGEVAEAVEEALTPVEVRPVRVLRVTGRRIRWLDGSGAPFLETPRATASLRLGGPGEGVVIADGVIAEPRLRLVQTGAEQWNYERPLAAFLDEEGGEVGDDAATPIYLRDMRVDDGYVLLDMLENTYSARSVDIRLAWAQVAGPRLDAPTFQVARASAELVLPDTAGAQDVVRAITLADAEFRLLEGAVAFDVLEATLGGSQLADLQGVWDPARGGLGLDMRLRAVDLRVADLPWLPGDIPEGAGGSFLLRLEPRPGERTGVSVQELAVRAQGSSATGSLRAVIGGASPVLEAVDLRVDSLALDLVEAFTGPLPYGGRVAGTIEGTEGEIRFDLTGNLTTPTLQQPFATTLTGRVALTEAGVELRGATVGLDRVPLAALEQLAPGLPLSGVVTGDVQLSGAPGAGPMQLDLRLEMGGGIVTIGGTADVSGQVPEYDVAGRIAGVELRTILEPAAPPVQLHATFDVEGRGLDPATARAVATVHGGFTGWQSEPGDTLLLQAAVADGILELAALRAEVGPVQLAAAGEWNFVGGGGRVRYEAAVAELGTLSAYLPPDAEGRRRFSTGSIRLAGTASGTLDAPVVAGEVVAEDFRWGEWAAEALSGDYEVDLAGGLPRIDVELVSEELRTPFGDYESLAATIDFGRPTFAIAVRADQEGGRGIVEIVADGRIDEQGQREVFLRSLEVDLQQQRWRLPSPARIAWTQGETVTVESVELVQTEGDGRIALEGVVAPLEQLQLSLAVASLPIGDVLRLVGSDQELAGELFLDGRVAGPAASPSVAVDLRLEDGSFRGVQLRSLIGEVVYDSARLVLDGEGLVGDSARLQVAGSVPARIQLAGGPLFELVDTAPIDVRISTRSFPLQALDPGLETVEDVEGRLLADVQIGGTPAQPQLSGAARVQNGALTIPLLDRRFENVHGTLDLSGRQARIQELVVESGGTARVEGTIDFQELTNPSLDLLARLTGFRFQGIEDADEAGLWGEVALDGSLAEPVMTGSIRANDGAVSLAPLQQPELSARLSDVDQLDLLDAGLELDMEEGAGGGGLQIADLTVRAGEDLWFITEEARVRLAGTLTVNKFGEALTIQGTLQGEGGSFELAAGPITRQFEIVSSEIRFFGSPEPNPRLDIVASRRVRVPNGEPVDVRVQVTGTLQNPSLGLAAATGADVPESELLSFLLFGQSTTDLGDLVTTGGLEGAGGQLLAYTGLLESLSAGINEEVGLFDYFRLEYLPGTAGDFGLFATAGVELVDDLFLDADIPLESRSAAWAVGLEYLWEGVGTLRGGLEPVRGLRGLVGAGGSGFLDREITRQGVLVWRKRWTY